jgi:hypothetical protein
MAEALLSPNFKNAHFENPAEFLGLERQMGRSTASGRYSCEHKQHIMMGSLLS